MAPPCRSVIVYRVVWSVKLTDVFWNEKQIGAEQDESLKLYLYIEMGLARKLSQFG